MCDSGKNYLHQVDELVIYSLLLEQLCSFPLHPWTFFSLLQLELALEFIDCFMHYNSINYLNFSSLRNYLDLCWYFQLKLYVIYSNLVAPLPIDAISLAEHYKPLSWLGSNSFTLSFNWNSCLDRIAHLNFVGCSKQPYLYNFDFYSSIGNIATAWWR